MDKIKVKVSSFISVILNNDASRFGFMKNGSPNKNALLNKLIPTLVEIRKARRDEISNILRNEYNREDSERIYSAVNTVIDRVYFSDEELNILDECIWIRPSKETMPTYDEIATSETLITAQEVPVYIRGLLNEYSRFPQYKRELLTFYKELSVFADACDTRQILHFTHKGTGERCRAFAFGYKYGFASDQTNYCIIYDIKNTTIKAIPLHLIIDIYMIQQKFKPSERLKELLQTYTDDCNFDEEIYVEVE